MKRLHDATATEILSKHKHVPLRVYSLDPVQAPRIARAREMLVSALVELRGPAAQFAHVRRTLVELGCGCCDISGFFSWGHHVHGWEINPACGHYVAKQWPWVQMHFEDLNEAEPMDCDILVLCETLEHLPDPLALVRRWMPRAQMCLVSSPLEGDIGGDLSGGEHNWSFGEADFEDFFSAGGHRIVRNEVFPMGQYRIAMYLGKRQEQNGDAKQKVDVEFV